MPFICSNEWSDKGNECFAYNPAEELEGYDSRRDFLKCRCGQNMVWVEELPDNPKYSDKGNEIKGRIMPQREFNTDAPDVMTMVAAYVDWLQEQGCNEQAELMNLDWGRRIGHVPNSEEVSTRVAELRKKLSIPQDRKINKEVDGQRGRKQIITLYLQELIGHWYTKATVNLLHVEKFLPELHAQPVLHLLLACNGTSAPALVSKYLNYGWLQKCETLELNNFEVGFVQLRELFTKSSIHPTTLIISGRGKQAPTIAQLQLLPKLCPPLKHLWRIDYHGVKYDYRFPEDAQPKW
jgi:hypothetical protein